MSDDQLPEPVSDSLIIQRFYELRVHLGLDLTELDHAFMVTSRILQQAGELVAEADKVQNIAKHAWEVVKAEVGEQLRAEYKAISEARITSMLPADPAVQEARQALDQAIYETKVCESLFRALDRQSSLLTKTADMMIAGYIAPSAAHDQRRAEMHKARIAANAKPPN